MKLLAGIESNRRAVIEKARSLKSPVLISANSLWSGTRFSFEWVKASGLEVYLDSGGFVAMKRYGGFRFSVEDYAKLAAEMRPVWWAQMDLCCEPEVAANRTEVFRRIDRTADNLRECRETAGKVGAAAPMVVLQGWKPCDYVSGPAFDDPSFDWPSIVGVGSVCRRPIHGPDGLLAVIGKLDAKLPGNVRLHLFGVKSAAAALLRNHPRVASVDSMAWSFRARVEARETGVPCTNELKAMHLERWINRQRERISTVNETPDLFAERRAA